MSKLLAIVFQILAISSISNATKLSKCIEALQDPYSVHDVIESLQLVSAAITIQYQGTMSYLNTTNQINWTALNGQLVRVTTKYEGGTPNDTVQQMVISKSQIADFDREAIENLVEQTPKRTLAQGFVETGLVAVTLGSGKKLISPVVRSNSPWEITGLEEEYNKFLPIIEADGSGIKDLLFMHTYPGKGTPLSPSDSEAFQRTVKHIMGDTELPDGDNFRLRSYVVPIEGQGELLFRQSYLARPRLGDIRLHKEELRRRFPTLQIGD